MFSVRYGHFIQREALGTCHGWLALPPALLIIIVINYTYAYAAYKTCFAQKGFTHPTSTVWHRLRRVKRSSGGGPK